MRFEFHWIASFGLLAVASCSTSSADYGAGVSRPGATSGVASTASIPKGGPGGADLKIVTDLPAPTSLAAGAETPLSPGDTLQIDIFQVPDLSRTVQIDAAGSIALPLINKVQAGGRSVGALQAEIESLYGAKYLQSPQVTVFVKESIGQRVTIDGEVAKAGVYPVAAGATLLQTLAQAGGFREIADTGKVYVYRSIEGRKLVANYNVAQIRKGSRPDPRIYGGDTVIVFTSAGKVAMQNLKEALGLARMAAPAGAF